MNNNEVGWLASGNAARLVMRPLMGTLKMTGNGELIPSSSSSTFNCRISNRRDFPMTISFFYKCQYQWKMKVVRLGLDIEQQSNKVECIYRMCSRRRKTKNEKRKTPEMSADTIGNERTSESDDKKLHLTVCKTPPGGCAVTT
jgi:hypothetical protein